MSTPDSRPETRGERDQRGRFAAGNTTSRLGGRPPAPREAAFLSATVGGCSPEQWTAVVDVVRKKALEGSAPHAALLARVLGLYRDDARPPEGDQGRGIGEALERDPGLADEILKVMDRAFSSPQKPAAS
jgi:hypothetical protein